MAWFLTMGNGRLRPIGCASPADSANCSAFQNAHAIEGDKDVGVGDGPCLGEASAEPDIVLAHRLSVSRRELSLSPGDQGFGLLELMLELVLVASVRDELV